MIKLWKGIACISLFLASCSSTQTDKPSYPTADIRAGINQLTTLKLNDEIESVSYVPLEVTSDDASLIDGVANYTVTDQYIYVLPVKEQRIALFDRQGHFIKTLVPYGQGPGEFSDMVVNIQADEKNNRLYLFSTHRIWIYTLQGEFIQQIHHDYQTIFEYQVDNDRFAAVALPYMPFQTTSFGLGIFTEKGDTIATKNDFYSPLVPPEKSGFTTSIAATYSGAQQSILFKTSSNDTIFRIAANKIEPACVLNLQNSDKEVIRALDITDFSDLSGLHRDDKDIFVADLFETPKRYYARFRYNQGHYVASIDKKTGETWMEKCEQPGTLKEMADVNLQHGMLGTRSYHNFPIWGRMEGNTLVQVVTPYELNLHKGVSAITIPENLNMEEEEGNPIFIFYKIKP